MCIVANMGETSLLVCVWEGGWVGGLSDYNNYYVLFPNYTNGMAKNVRRRKGGRCVHEFHVHASQYKLMA